jgi:hypothetical protein
MVPLASPKLDPVMTEGIDMGPTTQTGDDHMHVFQNKDYLDGREFNSFAVLAAGSATPAHHTTVVS